MLEFQPWELFIALTRAVRFTLLKHSDTEDTAELLPWALQVQIKEFPNIPSLLLFKKAERNVIKFQSNRALEIEPRKFLHTHPTEKENRVEKDKLYININKIKHSN